MKTALTILIFEPMLKSMATKVRAHIAKLRQWLILGGCYLIALLPARAETFFIDAIVPAPQAVEYGHWYVFGQTPGSPATVRIHLPSMPERLETAAAEAIRSRLQSLGLPRLSIEIARSDIRNTPAKSAHLEVLLGTAERHSELEEAYDTIGLEPLERAEGYRIRTVTTADGKLRFLLLGSDPRGTYYAAQSFLQMLTSKNDRLAVRALQIDDWPSFQSRASGNDEKPPSPEIAAAAVEWYARFKMNTWPLGQSYHWPANWRETPTESLQAIRRASALPLSSAVDLRYQIHPFGRSNDPEGRFTIRISSQNDLNIFIEKIRNALRAGASEILIRADDFHKLSNADKRAFASKAEAHAFLITESFTVIRGERPDVRFYFCPPYYTGEEARSSPEARAYLEELGRKIPPEIPILWTGPDVISESFTSDQQTAFASLVNRPVYLWDNTIFQEQSDFGYPYGYAWYWLHPMDTKHPPDLPSLSPGVRFNFGFNDSWINRIGNVVLADYLWNPSDFAPELALRRAVALCVGPESVEAFLDAAAQIRQIFELKHSPARWPLKTVPDDKSFALSMRRLDATALNEAAIDELAQHWRNLATSVEQLNQLEKHFAELRTHALTSFEPGDSRSWRKQAQGAWSSRGDGQIAIFNFPFETPGEAGNYGARITTFNVPSSSSGRYFLHFVFDDNYRASGGPPESYPDYFFKQVLIDGKVVWEDDAEGDEPIRPTTVEVSRFLRGKNRAELTVRCLDKKGVTNLGLTASISSLLLTSH